jgi:REP element-mobilizing transposase RayT
MVAKYWRKLPLKFHLVGLDEFIIMPNHIHGIINVGADPRVCPDNHQYQKGEHMGSPLQTKLGRIIQWFKTMTTNEYLREVRNSDWPQFPGRLWQRNYYEHIIRNSVELENIRRYIRINPNSWVSDPEHPANR